jgi:integrase
MAGCLGLRASEIMPLKWTHFDFERLSVLIDRSIVHGRVDDLKTEYSKDTVPLDPALIEFCWSTRLDLYPTPKAGLR